MQDNAFIQRVGSAELLQVALNVSTLSELLRKAAAGSEDEAGAEQVG